MAKTKTQREKNKDGDTDIAVLPEHLTLTEAEDLWSELRERCGSEGDVVLDGSNVARVTTPGVQVLLVTSAALVGSDRTLRVKSPSAALVGAFDELGLTAALEDWKEN